jgi:arylsulfatase A-like enzyme
VGFTDSATIGVPQALDGGFDVFRPGPKITGQDTLPRPSKITFGLAAAWLRERPAGPFFMFLHTRELEQPYFLLPDDVRSRLLLSRLDPGYGSEENTPAAGSRRMEALYNTEIGLLDVELGSFLSVIDKLGLADSTLVVVTADRGQLFGEQAVTGGGAGLQVQALHVPLLFRLSGILPAGRRVAEPVSLLDVGETMTAIIGIASLMGQAPARNLFPLMIGPTKTGGQVVFSQLTSISCREKAARPGACGYDRAVARDARYTYIEGLRGSDPLLFDRDKDPDETHDIGATNKVLLLKYWGAIDEHRRSLAGGTDD